MPGLCLEARYRLCSHADALAMSRTRVGDGSRRLALTTCDAAVLRSLAFDFHNRSSGRTDPGMRHLARRAGVALGTVPSSIRRLVAAGYLTLERRHLRVRGRVVRWTHSYQLAATLPVARSTFATEPRPVVKKTAWTGDRPAAAAALAAARESMLRRMVESGYPGLASRLSRIGG